MYRGPLPQQCPCTPRQTHIEVTENGKSHPQSPHRLGSTFWQRNQLTWGARYGQLLIITFGRRLSLLPLSQLTPTLFRLFSTRGSAGTSREVLSASTRATSRWTSSLRSQLPRQQERMDAPILHHAAPFPSVPSSFSSLFPTVVSQPPSPTGPNSLTESQRVARTVTAEEYGRKTSQLDCPKVGGTLHSEQTGSKPSQLAGQRVCDTRQAEQPGSRGSNQHQVGEEFLNFVMASELPVAGTTGRTANADEAGSRTPWVSSASRRGTSSKRSSTTQAPLAIVPRENVNAGRFGVAGRCSDAGLSGRCSHERLAEPIPQIVPERGV